MITYRPPILSTEQHRVWCAWSQMARERADAHLWWSSWITNVVDPRPTTEPEPEEEQDMIAVEDLTPNVWYWCTGRNAGPYGAPCYHTEDGVFRVPNAFFQHWTWNEELHWRKDPKYGTVRPHFMAAPRDVDVWCKERGCKKLGV